MERSATLTEEQVEYKRRIKAEPENAGIYRALMKLATSAACDLEEQWADKAMYEAPNPRQEQE